MTPNELPKTDSIQELVAFWDTHDLSDFQDELEDVTEPLFKRTGTSIQVRLTPAESTAVQRLAKSAGVSQSVLIRKWVRQQLKPRKNSAQFRS